MCNNNRGRVFSSLLLVLCVLEVQPWKLTTPEALLRYSTGGSVTVICHADVSLASCQVRTQYDKGNKEDTINLNNGKTSLPYTTQYYRATYYGTGLAQGQCGVKLSEIKEALGSRVFVCRARAVTGGWKDTQALLLRDDTGEFQLTVQSPRVVVVQNMDASLLFTTTDPMTVCYIWIPGESRWLTFNKGNDSPVLGRYRYHGTGLDQGQCGITITDVTEKDSGIVWVGAAVPGARQIYKPSILIVTVPPSEPYLVVLTGSKHKNGDKLEATCIVNGSVPVANITWYLGDKVIRNDLADDVPDLAWKWPWEKQSITQILRYRLSAEDDGKEVTCRITHEAFIGYKETKQKLTISDDSLECGKKGGSRTTLISGGRDAEVGEYPWHVGVYKRKNDTYSQQCGGTLIANNIVITAAHCFWNNGKGRLYNHTQYQVAVGKVLRSWDAQEEWLQKVAIRQIVVRPRYATSVANQMHDIAIVVLAAPITLSEKVNVACVDWANEFEDKQLADGHNGIATGWGLREDSTFSEILQSVSLPWISEETCWASIPTETRTYYTVDKFCAGYVGKGVSVCPADSGGGLLFQNLTTKQHYLRGIVSVSFAPSAHNVRLNGCYSQYYTGFTKLSVYLSWIQNYIKK